jgi:DNA-binding GntR family transcriptional regulator
MQERQGDRLYKALRRRILTRELGPHQRLVERDIAADFECSRIPVREAIHRLEREGLVENRPGWGSYVRHLTKTEWEQASELRALLEGCVFAAVAQRKPVRAFKQLRKILDDMRESCAAGDSSRSDELDLEFHQVLVNATGNKWLMEIYPRVAVPMIPITQYAQPSREMLLRSVDLHENVLRILQSGDASAAKLAGETHKDNLVEVADAKWEEPPAPRRKKTPTKTNE